MIRTWNGPLTKALVVEQPDPALDALLAADGIEVDRRTEVPDADRLGEMLRAGGHQVLFKRSRVPVTREVLERAPELLAVQLCCIGDDSVDKRACAEFGVMVFNDPVSNARSVVELAVAHLIALSRRLYETYDDTRGGGFDKSQTERFEIQGRTLGVLGLGNIGRQVARAAEQLGMRIRFHDNREVAREVGLEMGWEEDSTIDALFRHSDAVTVHVSAEDVNRRLNRGLLTADHFAQLAADRPAPSPRLFLNLARGFLYEPEDLLAAIGTGAVRRAAVDVYPEEPRGSAPWVNPYAGEPRVATTPHLGAATLDAQPRIARRVAQTIRGWSHHGSVRDCVFRPRAHIALSDIAPGSTLLSVVHASARGSRKALQDAMYEAGASNLSTVHQDFDELGMAYDLAAIDRPLDAEQIRALADRAAAITGQAGVIRSLRQVQVRG